MMRPDFLIAVMHCRRKQGVGFPEVELYDTISFVPLTK